MRSFHLVLLSGLLALFALAAQPPGTAEAFTGHGCVKSSCLYFTSSKKPTGYYFKRCDSAWRNVNRTYLQGFQTAEALLASYPNKTLHSDCSSSTPAPTTGAPVAHYTLTRNAMKVWFTNTSTGTGNTYLWDFGDESYSTETSPQHIYFRAGNYTVTLTATNSKGSNSYSRNVDLGVTPEPTAPPV
jgi:PKD repeat protein